MKRQLTEKEIENVDLWLERLQENKHDFVFNLEYQHFEPIRSHNDNVLMDEVYSLLAHVANVIEYNDPPINSRMHFTEKGLAVLEAGGYRHWENEIKALKEFQRKAPQLQEQLTKSTTRTNRHLRINMWLVLLVAALSLLVAYQQLKINQKQNERETKRESETRELKHSIQNVSTSLDSVNTRITRLIDSISGKKPHSPSR
jgi:hypothetical protein